MTAGELIDEIGRMISEGMLKRDSNVYLTKSMMPYEESELFSTGWCISNEPKYDEDNPTSKALFITGRGRVPNSELNGKSWREWGTGKDILVDDAGKMTDEEIERRIYEMKYSEMKKDEFLKEIH